MKTINTQQITNDLIDFAVERVGTQLSYAYLTGMLFSVLTDEQWQKLEQKIDKDTLFEGQKQ